MRDRVADEFGQAQPVLPEGWEVRRLSDAMRGDSHEPPWVIKNLLLAQSATQVSAHPHSMKSLTWLAAALEAAARQTVWGHFDAPGVTRSLFIETEDSPWVIEERIRGLAAGLGLGKTEDVPGFHYLRTGPFDLVRTEKTLEDILAYYRPDFAVFSTLQNVLGGRAIKEQQDMQDINALFMRIADKYCPIVQLTHSPWDTRQKRAMGTITQSANFLTSIHFEKSTIRDSTFVHATVDSKLGVEEADFTLRLETENGNVHRVLYEGKGRPKGAAKDVIQELLCNNPDAPAKSIAAKAKVSTRYVQKIKKGKGS